MLARIISVLILCFSSVLALAQSSHPIELAGDAPDRHIVVPGDTLWDDNAGVRNDAYYRDNWR